jgi:chromosome segregation ATPase
MTETQFTGLAFTIENMANRLAKMEESFAALVRIELAQVENGKAVERAFSEIAKQSNEIEELRREVSALRAELAKWETARQLAAWLVGLVGVPGLLGAVWYVARAGGAAP